MPTAAPVSPRLLLEHPSVAVLVCAQADDPAEPLGLQYDDSSLVLYGDPSRLSTRSRGSVMSGTCTLPCTGQHCLDLQLDDEVHHSSESALAGAHEQGETFFTALKRQPSWQSDTGSEAYTQVQHQLCQHQKLLVKTPCQIELAVAGPWRTR